jgi:hypothetical protein
MAKKANSTDWEKTDSKEWEVTSTGSFHPMWTPVKDGESLVCRPVSVRVIPAHGKVKAGGAMDVIRLGGSSTSFAQGGNKIKVGTGDTVTVPLSYNLVGEDRLAVLDKKGVPSLSKLAQLIVNDGQAFNIVFNGKVKGGGGSVKRFTVMAPRGYRERVLKTK